VPVPLSREGCGRRRRPALQLRDSAGLRPASPVAHTRMCGAPFPMRIVLTIAYPRLSSVVNARAKPKAYAMLQSWKMCHKGKDVSARLVVAGAASNVGKTTLTVGLLAAFKRRGIDVRLQGRIRLYRPDLSQLCGRGAEPQPRYLASPRRCLARLIRACHRWSGRGAHRRRDGAL
jgi:Mrp family chromosome partitioning ATPase